MLTPHEVKLTPLRFALVAINDFSVDIPLTSSAR